MNVIAPPANVPAQEQGPILAAVGRVYHINSDEKRDIICKMNANGSKMNEIVAVTGVNAKTAYRIIAKFQEVGTFAKGQAGGRKGKK
jgi:hypothetical protein